MRADATEVVWDTEAGTVNDQVVRYVTVLADSYALKAALVAGEQRRDEKGLIVRTAPARWITLPFTGLVAADARNSNRNGTLTALQDAAELCEKSGIETVVVKGIFSDARSLSDQCVDWEWVARELCGFEGKETKSIEELSALAAGVNASSLSGFRERAGSEDKRATFVLWAGIQQLAAMTRQAHAAGTGIVLDYPFADEHDPQTTALLRLFMEYAGIDGVKLAFSSKDSGPVFLDRITYLGTLAAEVRRYNPHAMIAVQGVEGVFLEPLDILPENTYAENDAREKKLVTVHAEELRMKSEEEIIAFFSGIKSENINIEMERIPSVADEARVFDFFRLMTKLSLLLGPKTEEQFFNDGYLKGIRGAARDLPGSEDILQNFSMLTEVALGDGTVIQGPSFYALTAAYRYARQANQPAMFSPDTFMGHLGVLLKESGSRQQLQQLDDLNASYRGITDSAEKASVAAQCAGFIQGYLETSAYRRYRDNGGMDVSGRYRDVFAKLLVETGALAGYDDFGTLRFAGGQAPEAAALVPGLLKLHSFKQLHPLLNEYRKTLSAPGRDNLRASLWYVEALSRAFPAVVSREPGFRQFFISTLTETLSRCAGTELAGATPDETAEMLALRYNAYSMALALGREPRNRELALHANDYEAARQSLRAALESMKKDGVLSTPRALLFVSLSHSDDLLADKEKASLLSTFQTLKLVTPYGVRTPSGLSPELLFHYVLASRQRMDSITADAALSEMHYTLNNLAGYFGRHGTLPGAFDPLTFIPKLPVTEPAAAAGMMSVLDVLDLEARDIYKVDTDQLQSISIKQMKLVLSSS